jgi:TfoX/Sxy family transcriptional regulator of competence genes
LGDGDATQAVMASDRKTVDFIIEQIAGAGAISARPMFGEYGVYCDGKIVAIIGDGQLFVRPTSGGRAYAAEAEEVSPYPGAKHHLLIDAERWDDGEWMTELVRVTCIELPLPKPKKAKRS